jgi:hypothetical protein
MLFVAVLTAALAATPGCASRRFDAMMRSWDGRSIDDLFRTWGPPNYLYSNGKGGQVAVYVPTPVPGASRTSDAAERLRRAASTRLYDESMTDAWPIYRIFFTDNSGRIARSEWRGRWECCSN